MWAITIQRTERPCGLSFLQLGQRYGRIDVSVPRIYVRLRCVSMPRVCATCLRRAPVPHVELSYRPPGESSSVSQYGRDSRRLSTALTCTSVQMQVPTRACTHVHVHGLHRFLDLSKEGVVESEEARLRLVGRPVAMALFACAMRMDAHARMGTDIRTGMRAEMCIPGHLAGPALQRRGQSRLG